MSYAGFIRERYHPLGFVDPVVRNTVTRFAMGEPTGAAGYNYPTQGLQLSLQVYIECYAHVTNGTFTVTLYKDGVAAGNICFQIATSITGVGSYSGIDTSVGAGGADFSSSSDWFLKYDYSSPNSTLSANMHVEALLLG